MLMQHKAQAQLQSMKSDPARQSTKAMPEQQRPERDYLLEKRGVIFALVMLCISGYHRFSFQLAVDFLFCLVLIEVLKQVKCPFDLSESILTVFSDLASNASWP